MRAVAGSRFGEFTPYSSRFSPGSRFERTVSQRKPPSIVMSMSSSNPSRSVYTCFAFSWSST